MSNPFPNNPQSKPNPDFELELLKQEYFFLQNTIEDYNKQIWVIKALGITGTGAVIGLALQQKQALIALMGCGIPIFFWVLESQWKYFQRGFYPRVSEIERILAMDFHLPKSRRESPIRVGGGYIEPLGECRQATQVGMRVGLNWVTRCHSI